MDIIKNTKRNIVYGLINKMVLLVMPFIMRTIINHIFGAEYLGLTSLFNSILSVLSITELGISSALVYNMYEPIANGNQKRVNELLNFYRKAYFVIGLIIFTVGGLALPFLPHFINGSYPKEINIYVVYLILLLNASIGYFMYAYKQSLLAAHQREDVNSKINLVVQLCMQFLQIVFLIFARNYYLYVVCLPIFTVANNIWINTITNRMFPDAKCEGQLDKEILRKIKKLVWGTFIQKFSQVTRNSFDSICLSLYVGLVITGIYTNYYTIFSMLLAIFMVFNTALAGGIGNHVAVKSIEENFEEMKRLDFLYMTFTGWCTICLLCLYQPFMTIWMGDDMLLPFSVVVLICVYFYLLKMGDMRALYSSAAGLWWFHRKRSISETILNIVLNFTLGYFWGIYGILLATIISIFCCNIVWGSLIVFEKYFNREMLKVYFGYHIKYILVTLCALFVTYFAVNYIQFNSIIITFLLKGLVSAILPIIIYFMIYFKTSIFKNSLKYITTRRKII